VLALKKRAWNFYSRGELIHYEFIHYMRLVEEASMQTLWKRIGAAAVAALAIVAFSGSANAQHHHHGGGGGFGPGFVGGLAAGAVLGGGYYGGDYYGGDYYDGPYAYGGGCYIQRQAFINRFGHRVIRRVRVCD
jgi:hypothetical protein